MAARLLVMGSCVHRGHAELHAMVHACRCCTCWLLCYKHPHICGGRAYTLRSVTHTQRAAMWGWHMHVHMLLY
jgi:hypothetical protein